MTKRVTDISKIVSGRIEWRLQVRVIYLWFISDFKNPNDMNSLEMVLLYAKVLAHISYLKLQ